MIHLTSNVSNLAIFYKRLAITVKKGGRKQEILYYMSIILSAHNSREGIIVLLTNSLYPHLLTCSVKPFKTQLMLYMSADTTAL